MIHGEKPTLALALDGPKKKGPPMAAMDMEAEEGLEPVSDEETDPSIVEAAGALRAAFQGDDDAELARTLKGFIQLCGECS